MFFPELSVYLSPNISEWQSFRVLERFKMSKHISWLCINVMCVLLCIELTKSSPTSAENEVQSGTETFVRSYGQRMKSFMNASADPCDNFYAYACGNYPHVIEDLETPTKRSNLFDAMFILYDQLDAILRKIRHPTEEYYEELQIAKRYVNTCANAKLVPIEPSEEYLEVIKTIGGFPAIDSNWDESAFDWFNMTAHLTRYGIVGLVEEEILQIYPFKPYYKLPRLGFGFDVYLENIATNKSDGYVYNEKIMRKLLQVYNVSGTSADEVIGGVFELWRDILKLMALLPDVEFVRNTCQQLTGTLNLRSDFEKWANLFKIAWNVPVFSITHESYCPCDWFYNKLDILAEKKSKAFANYMALKFLFSMHPQLESAKFQRRECIAVVKAAIPMVFSHFYMKEQYKKEDEDDIFEMILELKTSWKHAVNSADWLSDTAHDEALQKLETLSSRIGQVVDPISDVYIKQTRALNPTDNVAMNTLQLAKFKVDMRHYGYLHRSGNRNTPAYGILDAVKIRAFCILWENKINLMGGLLHLPIYHKDFPNSVKYGSLGYIIGHEIGHGFQGSGFAITSNLTHRSWLSKKSIAVAKQRSDCFVDDYNNYEEPAFNHKLNGKKALSEIQADSLGLRQAFEAYRRLLKYTAKHENDDFLRKEYLLGLNMSQEQTFFLTFAQLYCSRYEPKNYWGELNSKHPLHRYRVMGTLRNSDEFSKVFNCPSGSSMNPSSKCRLW